MMIRVLGIYKVQKLTRCFPNENIRFTSNIHIPRKKLAPKTIKKYMGHLINSFYNFPSHDTILNENVYTKYKYRCFN